MQQCLELIEEKLRKLEYVEIEYNFDNNISKKITKKIKPIKNRIGTSVNVIIDSNDINTISYFLHKLKIINESHKNLYYKQQRESAFFGSIDRRSIINDRPNIREAIEKNTITIKEIINIIDLYYKE